MEPSNNPPDPKSFALYTGKAPALIQIIGGLLWLGAAGLIILGILNILINPIWGILYLIVATLFIITARSMFKMKKVAFRNSIILAIFLIIVAIYGIVGTTNSSYTNFIYPIVLLIIVYIYKDRFVN